MIERMNIELSNIYDIVLKHTNISAESLSEHTRVGEDLCIIGDDAEELLDDFKEEFEVDMSNFKFEEYFPDESTANMHFYMSAIAQRKNIVIKFMSYFDKYFWKALASKHIYKTLTLKELLDCAKRGSWK